VIPALWVVDASVLIKWFAQEPGRDKALKLYERYREGTALLAVPELCLHEMANWLSRARPPVAGDLDQLFKHLPEAHAFQRQDHAEIARVLSHAIRSLPKATAYDAAYAQLASVLERPLLTADEGQAKLAVWFGAQAVLLEDYR